MKHLTWRELKEKINLIDESKLDKKVVIAFETDEMYTCIDLLYHFEDEEGEPFMVIKI